MLGYPTLLLLNSVACEYLLLNIFIPLSTWIIHSSKFLAPTGAQEVTLSVCPSIHVYVCLSVILLNSFSYIPLLAHAHAQASNRVIVEYTTQTIQ